MGEYLRGKGAIVEAIEAGRIVRVPEEYALREGLLVLRKPQGISLVESTIKPKCVDGRDVRLKKPAFLGFDEFRKPLKSEENEITRELVENFHWALVSKRKARGLTRKQVAESIGEPEANVKLIENGVLPMDNFVLVNKLENYYGINMRKSGKVMCPVVTKKKEEGFKGFNAIKKEQSGKGGELKVNESGEDVFGDDLLIEDET